MQRRLTENEVQLRVPELNTTKAILVTTDTLVKVVDGPVRGDGASIVYMTPMEALRNTRVDFDFALSILTRGSADKVEKLVMARCAEEETVLRAVHVFYTGREVVSWAKKVSLASSGSQQYLVMNEVEARCAIQAEVCFMPCKRGKRA